MIKTNDKTYLNEREMHNQKIAEIEALLKETREMLEQYKNHVDQCMARWLKTDVKTIKKLFRGNENETK